MFFPDGKYRVKAELTGNWASTLIQKFLGFKKIDPLAFYVVLTQAQHRVSVNFEVVAEPLRLSVFGG